MESKKEEINNQLQEVREEKHETYSNIKKSKIIPSKLPNEKKFETNYHYNNNEKNNPDEIWPHKTILIVGDSMINQLDEERLSKSTKRNVKVRSFGGANIKSMYEKINPLLKKKPQTIILHVGTNDTVSKTPDIIIDDMLKLKHYIELQLQSVNVIFSCHITRSDNSKAKRTIMHLNEKNDANEGKLFIKL